MVLTDEAAGMRGVAAVVPEICVPGSAIVRTSVLATWADVLAGIPASRSLLPRVPVTLDLDVQLHRQPVGATAITGRSSVVKAGQSIVVCDVWFWDGVVDEPFAFSHATFMASPNPDHVITESFSERTLPPDAGRLPAPFADRAGVRHLGAGVAEVPRTPIGLNGIGAIQGGLLALVAEEAATGDEPEPVVATGLAVRYLRSFAVGPARATATRSGGLAHVRIVDAGRDDRLGAVATVRTVGVRRGVAGGPAGDAGHPDLLVRGEGVPAVLD